MPARLCHKLQAPRTYHGGVRFCTPISSPSLRSLGPMQPPGPVCSLSTPKPYRVATQPWSVLPTLHWRTSGHAGRPKRQPFAMDVTPASMQMWHMSAHMAQLLKATSREKGFYHPDVRALRMQLRLAYEACLLNDYRTAQVFLFPAFPSLASARQGSGKCVRRMLW